VAKQLTRKELKTDKFVLEFEHGVEIFSEHRQQIVRWGSVALGLIVIIVAVNMYRNHARGLRQDALHSAMEIQNSTVGAAQNEFTVSFPTAAERDKAVQKAFTDLAAKYPGTDEAAMGDFFLGTNAADRGSLPEAEKHFKAVVDSGRGVYVSVAKLSLAQIYASEGKVFVSKEAATIALGQLLQASNPDRARKILEPLRTSTRPGVSKAALDAVAQLPPPKK
jgi:predicted negative regulator of RcsB-dependent stress response